MDGVGKTSLLVAAMRAAETKRSDEQGRLFSDPFAEKLAGPEGEALLQRALVESGDQPAIAIRTAFIDQKINEALARGSRQIVMLAAGMDSRSYRMQFPKGTVVFELDRKEVLDYKHERLKDATPACERKAIMVDLREDWPTLLLQNGFKKGEPTVWMVEGLLMYLEEADVMKLLQRITALASSKDVVLFDILSRSLLESPFMEKQLKFLTSMGAPWRFGHNEPEEMMKSFGWKATATQAGEFAPTRWPFPTAPRSVPGLPRGYYIEAFKD